jgi:hypothetical protein
MKIITAKTKEKFACIKDETMTSIKLTLFTIFILLGTLFSCQKKANVIPTNETTQTNNNHHSNLTNSDSSIYPTAIPNSTSNPQCSSPGQGDQAYDYYKIPVSGSGSLSGGIMWSTIDNYSGPYNQNIFFTDQRLKIRVLVKANPGTCKLPAGFSGANWLDAYTKLKFSVTLRSQEQTPPNYFEKIDFSDISVGQCSTPVSFANIPVSSMPLVLEIRDVTSDFYCVTTKTRCPYVWINTKACWSLELQVVTDSTKDF